MITAAGTAGFAALLCLISLFLLKLGGFLPRLLDGPGGIVPLLHDALDLLVIAALSNMALLTIVYCHSQIAGGAATPKRRSFESAYVRHKVLEAIAAIAAAELLRLLFAAQPGAIQ